MLTSLRITSSLLRPRSTTATANALHRSSTFPPRRQYSVENTVLRFHKHGNPLEVLKYETETLRDIQEDEVLIDMECAPLNQADIDIIRGEYPYLPKLPAVGGIEGCGVVIKAGSNVKNLKISDRVSPVDLGFGTWTKYAIAKENQLLKVPGDLQAHVASAISVNMCTAYRLVNDFVDLKEGDVIIQNGASSMVAQMVQQLCQQKGILSINVFRHETPDEDLFQKMTLARKRGGDIVVPHSFLRTHNFKSILSGLPPPKLALNCVGGPVATDIARLLAEGGTLVTYGAMSREPVVLPNSLLIFRNIVSRGFHMGRWYKTHTLEEREAMNREIISLLRHDKLRVFLEGHKMSEWKYAFECYGAKNRHGRKFIFECGH